MLLFFPLKNTFPLFPSSLFDEKKKENTCLCYCHHCWAFNLQMSDLHSRQYNQTVPVNVFQNLVFQKYMITSLFSINIRDFFSFWNYFPILASTVALEAHIQSFVLSLYPFSGFPDSSVGKDSAWNAGDPGSIPGLGRSAGEGKGYPLQYSSLVAQLVKNLPAVCETWVQSLGWEDPLEKWKVTHSGILAWRILWTV